MLLYFAYGSNMNPAKLAAICGEEVGPPLLIACLANHRIGFGSSHDPVYTPVASLVPESGALVWGVVFEVSDQIMAKLDAAAGVTSTPAVGQSITVTVKTKSKVSAETEGETKAKDGTPIADGSDIEVRTHNLVKPRVEPMQPDDKYLAVVVAAATQYGLPAEYIKQIKEIAAKTGLEGFIVDDVRIGQLDPTECRIEQIYTKVTSQYAVYRTPERVAVQYADFQPKAAQQRKDMAALNPARTQITGLIDDWSRSHRQSRRIKARKYQARVAAALILCLEGDDVTASTYLNAVQADIGAERRSLGRFEYMLFASAAAFVAILLFTWLQRQPIVFPHAPSPLWLSARAGTVGAFFSIALAIRNRTVLTNLRRSDNFADAALRILIGVIAAGVLILVLGSNMLPSFKLGEAEISGTGIVPETILALGFVAGFFERLVPDLLAKAVAEEKPSSKSAVTTPEQSQAAGSADREAAAAA